MSTYSTNNQSGKQNAPADVLFETWKQHIGTPAPVNDTVQRLTCRPPRIVEAWAEDLAAHLG